MNGYHHSALVSVESFERRMLYSASEPTILGDLENVASVDTPTLTYYLSNTLKVDLKADVAAGTPGRGPLRKSINHFASDIANYTNVLDQDINNLIASADHYATVLPQIASDEKAYRAAVGADYALMSGIFNKHGDIASALQSDVSAFQSEWATFKADFKTLKTDLA